MTASRTLTDVVRLAERVVPGLRGELRQPDAEVAAGLHHVRPARADANRLALTSMTARWASDYPEAGRHYCALRCWGLLIWQPVYVSVIGVHLARSCPSLRGFCQPLDDGCASGFSLDDHIPFQGCLEARLQFAANEIDAFCGEVFDELTRVIKLNPAAARALQADCVLAALLALRSHRPDWDDRSVEALGARWLSALRLAGESAYFSFRQTNGATRLALDRKTCCHHFRRRDGELCSTCPKLEMSERIIRLNADLDATAPC